MGKFRDLFLGRDFFFFVFLGETGGSFFYFLFCWSGACFFGFFFEMGFRLCGLFLVKIRGYLGVRYVILFLVRFYFVFEVLLGGNIV